MAPIRTKENHNPYHLALPGNPGAASGNAGASPSGTASASPPSHLNGGQHGLSSSADNNKALDIAGRSHHHRVVLPGSPSLPYGRSPPVPFAAAQHHPYSSSQSPPYGAAGAASRLSSSPGGVGAANGAARLSSSFPRAGSLGGSPLNSSAMQQHIGQGQLVRHDKHLADATVRAHQELDALQQRALTVTGFSAGAAGRNNGFGGRASLGNAVHTTPPGARSASSGISSTAPGSTSPFGHPAGPTPSMPPHAASPSSSTASSAAASLFIPRNARRNQLGGALQTHKPAAQLTTPELLAKAAQLEALLTGSACTGLPAGVVQTLRAELAELHAARAERRQIHALRKAMRRTALDTDARDQRELEDDLTRLSMSAKRRGKLPARRTSRPGVGVLGEDLDDDDDDDEEQEGGGGEDDDGMSRGSPRMPLLIARHKPLQVKTISGEEADAIQRQVWEFEQRQLREGSAEQGRGSQGYSGSTGANTPSDRRILQEQRRREEEDDLGGATEGRYAGDGDDDWELHMDMPE